MNPRIKMEKVIGTSYGNIGGLVVQKQGQIVYEQYYKQYSKASYFHLFSVTKSIVSLLIGIAIDEGFIESIDQKVLDFFPEYAVRKGEKTIQEVTLRHLLTMTAPYRQKKEDYKSYFSSQDWVKASLDELGGKDKIGDFRYAPLIGSDILSGILAKVTGASVLEFANKKLFEPLGMKVSETIQFESEKAQMNWYQEEKRSSWVAGPTGIHTAGWGICLRAVDMVKIGELVLQGGRWQEQQLISSSWIEEMKRVHSKWEKEKLKYGYLWWILDEKEQSYAAMGDGGNIIYINESKDLVVAIAANLMPKVADSRKLIKDYIEPAFV